MNMFVRFDENPAMTLQDIKETKHYGQTHASTDGQRRNSIPTTKFAGVKLYHAWIQRETQGGLDASPLENHK